MSSALTISLVIVCQVVLVVGGFLFGRAFTRRPDPAWTRFYTPAATPGVVQLALDLAGDGAVACDHNPTDNRLLVHLRDGSALTYDAELTLLAKSGGKQAS